MIVFYSQTNRTVIDFRTL